MNKFYKKIDGDYITAIGTGVGDTQIAQEEYDHILSIIRSRPTAEPGYMYKLRTDLTWEKVEAPKKQEMPDREISDKAALEIILGGGRA